MRFLEITDIKDFNLIIPTLLSLHGDSLETIELHSEVSPGEPEEGISALPAGVQRLNDTMTHMRLSGVKKLKFTAVIDKDWGCFGVGLYQYELRRQLEQEVRGWDSRWELICRTKGYYESFEQRM